MKTVKNDVTKHYKYRRYKRDKFIKEHLVDGDGYMVDGFIVDKGHRRGAEVHSITSNGVIIVHNLASGKLVTKLLARPQQIKRYYEKKNYVNMHRIALGTWIFGLFVKLGRKRFESRERELDYRQRDYVGRIQRRRR